MKYRNWKEWKVRFRCFIIFLYSYIYALGFSSFFLGKSFLPGSLGDGDVTRAIFLGLTACGLAAVPALPAI